ncbi:tyrosine-type recombinase/integrase [Acidovorax sp. SUPP1855]|uniref:tyrosine-type recombinase/integrase n=1 Tax=Acidovorax sp. SUPP1855 TaxID=431774 RepID=UPI0023DE62D6|nr:tyrosine-type recombinase/integrase [Acidovorax sp. SUPP1855]GKS86468.1 tyrosine-type recombinase/integrase [Acidovorax sp. SUPP1855]
MASIRKYRDKWRAEVQRHGIRKSHLAATKREAQAWALAAEAELDALKSSGGRTLGDAVAEYVRTVSARKSKPKWEERRFDFFMEHFGANTPLAQITTAEVGKWRDARLACVVGATVQREANLLRNLFTVAREEWRWIDHNPFRGVRMPEQAESRRQVWGWRDIRRVLRADRDKKMGEVVKAFHIALHTGMRLSEVLEGVYDTKRRVYQLQRTKTTGYVEVPITRRAARLLPAQFSVEANEASTLFSRLTRQLLIKDLTFHDTRATALTLLSRKVDVMTLARISRHKDLKILLNTYYRETAEQISARI